MTLQRFPTLTLSGGHCTGTLIIELSLTLLYLSKRTKCFSSRDSLELAAARVLDRRRSSAVAHVTASDSLMVAPRDRDDLRTAAVRSARSRRARKREIEDRGGSSLGEISPPGRGFSNRSLAFSFQFVIAVIVEFDTKKIVATGDPLLSSRRRSPSAAHRIISTLSLSLSISAPRRSRETDSPTRRELSRAIPRTESLFSNFSLSFGRGATRPVAVVERSVSLRKHASQNHYRGENADTAEAPFYVERPAVDQVSIASSVIRDASAIDAKLRISHVLARSIRANSHFSDARRVEPRAITEKIGGEDRVRNIEHRLHGRVSRAG